jgi:hypothetical protein
MLCKDLSIFSAGDGDEVARIGQQTEDIEDPSEISFQ